MKNQRLILKNPTSKFDFHFILKKLILISFFFFNILLTAQNSTLIFNDLGKGNSHKYWEKYSPNENISSRAVLNQLYKDNILITKDSLVLIKSKISNGVTHNFFQQLHNDLPVENAVISFHSINDYLIAFNGNLVSSLPNYNNTSSVIETSDAVEIAKTKIGASKYAWEDDAYVKLIREIKKDDDFSIKPNPVLTFYKKSYNYVLSYKMEVHTIEPQGRYTVFIDANSGEKLDILDNLQNSNASGTCATHSHGNQSLDFDLNGPNYELTDKLGTTNRNMETFLLPNNSVTYTSATIPFMNASSPVTDCFNLTTNFDQAALDIHWATGVVYDYFETLGINSFDDNGTLIRSYSNYGNNNNSNNNAFWNGSFFTYGVGGGSPFAGPVVTIDVAAHEFGHALTQEYGGGLQYQGESGAINESISDIIAASVEHFTITNNSNYAGLVPAPNPWIISKLNGGGLRDLSNPNLFGMPDTYQGSFWASTSGPDHGGVHTNSSVGNYWFYLLANSAGSFGNQVNDNGTTYNVNSIGFDDALAIVLESYNYMTNTSNYIDFRNATITAAELLFNDSRVCEVINAWDAVGVGVLGESCTIQSGIAYTQTQFCIAQAMSFSNLFIQNASSTYTWTFNGATITSYDLNINAPTTAGIYPLVQTLTDNATGNYVTNEMKLYINDCSPIDTSAHNAFWYFANKKGFDFSNGIAQITSFPYRNFEKGTNFSIGNDLKYYIAATATDDTMKLYDSADNILADLSPLFCSARKIGSSAPDANNEYINLFLSSSSQGTDGLYRLTVRIDASGNVNYNNFTPVSGPAYVSTDVNGAIKTLESIAIIPGCNSSVFWLIAPKVSSNGNGVLVYKLDYSNTSSSFSNYGDLTLEHDYTPSNAIGAVVATSPDGRFVSLHARMYEFDRSTGAFTNFAYHGQNGYGCFSSNSRFYYESNYVDDEIYQYDLFATNVVSSKTLIGVLPSYLNLNDLELGPDGKIYVSSSVNNVDSKIGVINNPNVKEINGSTQFNPFAYYLRNGSKNGITIFPDFTETYTVKDEPLTINFSQENCNTFKFTAPVCKPYYTWDFGDGTVLTNTSQDEITHSFSGTGPFTVSLTSNINGTVTTVSEVINFGIDVNSIEIVGPSSTCEVNNYFSAPTGYQTYAWSIVSGTATVNNAAAQETTITNSGSNFTVQVILTDFFGCTASLIKNVTLGSAPNIDIVSTNCKTANCNGEIVFDITGSLAPYSYSVNGSISGTSNSQVSLTNLCVDNYSIMVTNNIGCQGFQFHSSNCVSTLPVELLSFNASMNNDKTVSLNWETLTEINNDFFTVERSYDGENWEFITSVSGAGNTNEAQNYSVLDLTPIKGIAYYRLKQTDFDLNFSYSRIISLNNTVKKETQVLISPNPTENIITIEASIDLIGNMNIYNILGKEVISEITIVNTFKNKAILDLSNLPNGVYYFKHKDFSTKILKRNHW